MAKARSSTQRRSRKWPWVLVILLIVLIVAGWYACSCRFVAGRDLSDCAKDKLEGMEFVTLAEDVDSKSVTARFPLIASDTASYREGFGCVLEEWDG